MNEQSYVKKEIDRYLSELGEVPPHWVFRPDSHPYSIGWRMGDGESFVEVFYTWFEEYLTTENERINYFLKHDPPPRWLASVIESIWDLEGWNDPDFDYYPYLEKLKHLGFKGTDQYQADLNDEKWL